MHEWRRVSTGTLITLLACLVIFPLRGDSAPARPVLMLVKGMGAVSLGSELEILEDRDGTITIDDILKGAHKAAFRRVVSPYPSYGFSRAVYWVRFTAANPGSQGFPWLLELAYPHIAEIEFWRIDDSGTVLERQHGGSALPFASRVIHHASFVFPFTAAGGATHRIYARLRSDGVMNIFLTAWEPSAFAEAENRSQLLLGMYYGALLIMILFNLFLLFAMSERSYLWYVLYCCAFMTFQLSLDGLAFQYLWPGQVWWASHNLPPLLLVSVIFAMQFSRVFLHIAKNKAAADRVLLGFMAVCIVAVPATLFIDYSLALRLAVALAIIAAISLSVLSYQVLIGGYRPARFYVIAWTAFWIASIINAMKYAAIVPDTDATRSLLHVAMLVQLVLLSLGLADRINFMRGQLQDLNANLEGLVTARAGELNAALQIMEQKDREIQLEFELAGNIQRGILPTMPFYFEGIKVDAFYRAMGKVGGDFFDIFHMKGGYLGVLIADASGHGMPAAFITALAKISFVEAIQTYLFPADIFRQVNSELTDAIKTDDFVTAFFVVISPSFEVFYGNASHMKALVLRAETEVIEEWDTNGLFMGAMEEANAMYEERLAVLSYGDRIFLYTDGITESRDTSGRGFGESRLKQLIRETAKLGMGEAKDRIVTIWNEFTADAVPYDDASLVIIEIDPAYRSLIEFRERGFKLLWQRRYREAIAELSQALSINPRDEKSHLYIGECYLKEGDHARSVEHLQQFLKNNEVDANVWYHLSQAHFYLGDYEKACSTARKASHLKNNFIDAMDICALSLKALGKIDEAVRLWERILVLEKGHETALRELGRTDDV